MAHGDTPEEAMREIQVAMRLWLEAAAEVNKEIPIPKMFNDYESLMPLAV